MWVAKKKKITDFFEEKKKEKNLQYFIILPTEQNKTKTQSTKTLIL